MKEMLLESIPSLNLLFSLQIMSSICIFRVHSYSKRNSKLFHNINV